MHRHNLKVAFTVLYVVSCSRFLCANDFWTKKQLSQSSWNSAYTTPDGTEVLADLNFDGDDGTYDTNFGQGRLSDIEYGIDTTSMPGKPAFQITGKWSFQGESGRFLFQNNGRDEFKGTWQGSIGKGTWTGTAKFGSWKKDPGKNRYYCQYQYPAKDDPTKLCDQTVLWYPDDPDRCGYYYFANNKSQIWGRCICPEHPDYDASAMQWSKLNGNDWNELPKGECPAPKDGDPNRSAIGRIPDPPA